MAAPLLRIPKQAEQGTQETVLALPSSLPIAKESVAMLGAGRAAAGAGQPPGEGREQTQVSRLHGGGRGGGNAVLRALLHLQPWTAAKPPCALGPKTEPSHASCKRIPVLLGTSAWGLVVKTSSYKDP